jgi:hypothetical protein
MQTHKLMRRGRLAAVAAVAVAALGGFAAIATGKTASRGKPDSGTSYVSIVHAAGKTQYAAGYTFDKRFGQTAVTYVTSIGPGGTGTVTVIGKRVTLYTRNGSLYGTGSAVENLLTGAVTKGKLKLTHGTGAQKGHSFSGTFAGSYDAKARVYTFHYKGTYK